jgi:OOP family OmpA-OmpF porin
MSMKASLVVSAICLALQTSAFAEVSSVKTVNEPGKVIASGSVPDEASRATILARLRELYGAQNVVDRLEIGGVVPPPIGRRTWPRSLRQT